MVCPGDFCERSPEGHLRIDEQLAGLHNDNEVVVLKGFAASVDHERVTV